MKVARKPRFEQAILFFIVASSVKLVIDTYLLGLSEDNIRVIKF